MKNILFAVLAAFAVTAAPAFAQVAPPNPPTAAMRQQFMQAHRQFEQIHASERSQMLAALTSAHRALLAQVVGQLAISSTPNFQAAASRLDSSLSAGEKQSILNAAQSARTKMRAAMQSMRTSFTGSRPSGHPMMRNGQPRTPDAGRLLLRSALPGPQMHARMMMRIRK